MGFYLFSIRAEDSLDRTATQNYTLVIDSSPIFIANFLPIATVGVPYSLPIFAAGGLGTLTYSLPGGPVDGLTLDPVTGILSGIPVVAGDFSFVVRVTDSVGAFAEQTFTLLVEALPIILPTPTPSPTPLPTPLPTPTPSPTPLPTPTPSPTPLPTPPSTPLPTPSPPPSPPSGGSSTPSLPATPPSRSPPTDSLPVPVPVTVTGLPFNVTSPGGIPYPVPIAEVSVEAPRVFGTLGASVTEGIADFATLTTFFTALPAATTAPDLTRAVAGVSGISSFVLNQDSPAPEYLPAVPGDRTRPPLESGPVPPAVLRQVALPGPGVPTDPGGTSAPGFEARSFLLNSSLGQADDNALQFERLAGSEAPTDPAIPSPGSPSASPVPLPVPVPPAAAASGDRVGAMIPAPIQPGAQVALGRVVALASGAAALAVGPTTFLWRWLRRTPRPRPRA